MDLVSPEDQLRLFFLAAFVTVWLVGFAGAQDSYPESEGV